MRCDKIQELLKSDHLDGRLSRQEEKEVLEHLKVCSQCRQLEQELSAIRQGLQAGQQQPPERVWQHIRQAIISEQVSEEENAGKSIVERLKKSIWAPRPVFVLASAATVVIFIAVFAGLLLQNRQSISKTGSTNGIEQYSITSQADELIYGLGTDIEEYFL